MYRFIKAVIFFATFAVAIPFLFLIGDDVLFFQPRWVEIQKRWERADELHMQLPATVSKLIKAAYPESKLSGQVSRLLQKSSPTNGDTVHNESSLRTLSWGVLVNFHLSQTEQIAIILTEMPFPSLPYRREEQEHRQDKGFAFAAERSFHRPLHKLSEDELALLVAEAVLPAHSPATAIKQQSEALLRQIGYGEEG